MAIKWTEADVIKAMEKALGNGGVPNLLERLRNKVKRQPPVKAVR